MKFVDTCEITVIAGAGGNGAIRTVAVNVTVPSFDLCLRMVAMAAPLRLCKTLTSAKYAPARIELQHQLQHRLPGELNGPM